MLVVLGGNRISGSSGFDERGTQNRSARFGKAERGRKYACFVSTARMGWIQTVRDKLPIIDERVFCARELHWRRVSACPE